MSKPACGQNKDALPRALAHSLRGQRRGDDALTANGGNLFNNGQFTVEGTRDDANMSVNFSNMDVELPVASVRQFAKSGYGVTFNETCGERRDPKSKAEVSFIAMGGVFVPEAQMTSAE